MIVVPPGSGIVHQVNLEYLARVVFDQDGLLYPDSVVGTDSHTTMINGLGVVGWGVGGIEAEAVMLGIFNCKRSVTIKFTYVPQFHFHIFFFFMYRPSYFNGSTAGCWISDFRAAKSVSHFH